MFTVEDIKRIREGSEKKFTASDVKAIRESSYKKNEGTATRAVPSVSTPKTGYEIPAFNNYMENVTLPKMKQQETMAKARASLADGTLSKPSTQPIGQMSVREAAQRAEANKTLSPATYAYTLRQRALDESRSNLENSIQKEKRLLREALANRAAVADRGAAAVLAANHQVDQFVNRVGNLEIERDRTPYINDQNSVGFLGRFESNLDLGRLTQDKNAAWNEYYENPTELNRRKAESLSQTIETYVENNAEALAGKGLISRSLAGYLPQFKDQTFARIGGGLAGSLIGAPKTGAALASGAYSLRQMRGAAYESLINAGVPEEIARKAAQDEGILSAMIEMADTGMDIFTFGALGGKTLLNNLLRGGTSALARTGASEASQSAAKKLLKGLGAYGLNIVGEGAQEAAQEVVSIANQERALSGGTGLKNLAGQSVNKALNLSEQGKAQVWDSAKEGMKIAAMMGAATKVGTSVINQGFNSYNDNLPAQQNTVSQPLQQPSGENILRRQVDEYIADSVSKSRFVENPVITDEKKPNLSLGKVAESLTQEIRKTYGQDISGREHVLNDNDIRHIYNRHGPHTKEKYPITVDDLRKIPDIITQYDEVYYVERKDGKSGIVYEKRHNGVTYYLEQVMPDSKTLQNKQMIKTSTGTIPDIQGLKEAIIKKRSAFPAPDDAAKAVPRMYAHDVKENASSQTIPQNQQQSNAIKFDPFAEGAQQNTFSQPLQAPSGETSPAPKANTFAAAESPAKPTEVKERLHIDQRTYADTKSKSVNAFQYDNPEVKPFIQEQARTLLGDLQTGVKGERFPVYGEQGEIIRWDGAKRMTSEPIAKLLDMGYDYASIERALNNIIRDAGRENTPVAKAVELVIDDALSDGYRDMTGEIVQPDTGYIATKSTIPGAQPNALYSAEDLRQMQEESAGQVDPGAERGYTNNRRLADLDLDTASWEDINSSPEIVEARKRAESGGKTSEISSPERESVRANVLANLLAKGSFDGEDYSGPIRQDRKAFIVIGPPAAGKSSVFADPLSRSNQARVIDSDMAKALLPEFDNGYGASRVHEESSDIAERLYVSTVSRGDNLVYPLVGSNTEKIRRIINELKEKGYTVGLYFNELPVDKAARRAIKRFMDTGRLVDTDYVLSVGDKPKQTYLTLKEEGIADEYEWRNNDVEYGQQPILIERYNSGTWPSEKEIRRAGATGFEPGRDQRRDGLSVYRGDARGSGRREMGNERKTEIGSGEKEVDNSPATDKEAGVSFAQNSPFDENLYAVSPAVKEVYDGLSTRAKELYRQIVSGVSALERADRATGERYNINAAIQLLRQASGTSNEIMTTSLVDSKNKKIGGSYLELIAQIPEKDLALFNEYCQHLHNIDRMSIESKAQGLYIKQINEFVAKYRYLIPNGTTNIFQYLQSQAKINGGVYAIAFRELETINKVRDKAKNKPVLGVDSPEGMRAVTAIESGVKVDLIESEHPEFKRYSDDIQKWWNDFFKAWAVDTGLVSRESYKAMREMYPHYIPTYRVDQQSGSGGFWGRGINKPSVVKKATGGFSEIVPLEEAFAQRIATVVQAARRNDIYQRMYEMARSDPQEALKHGVMAREHGKRQQYYDFADSGELTEADFEDIKKLKGDRYELTTQILVDDGKGGKALKDVDLNISADIYEGLKFLKDKGLSDGALKMVYNAGKKLTDPIKQVTTGASAPFAARNTLRDLPTYLINTEAGMLRALKNYGIAIMDALSDTDAYRRYEGIAKEKGLKTWNTAIKDQYKSLGGSQSGFYNRESGFKESAGMGPKTMGQRVKTAVQSPLRLLNALGEFTEKIPRMAEYRNVIESLGDDFESQMKAALAAADVTVNFSRSAPLGKAMNAWILYSNANIQGFDKLIRTIKAHPVRTLARASVLVALPSALLMLLNDDNPYYEELDERTRDQYFLIPNLRDLDENGNARTFIKIPRSREYGVLLGGVFDRMARYAQTGDFNGSMEGFLKSVWGNMAPTQVLQGNFLKPITTEIPNNRDWAGRPIESQSDVSQNVPAEYRYDINTSRLAIAMGNSPIAGLGHLMGMERNLSPDQIDYLLGQYGGYIADVLQGFTSQKNAGATTGETVKNTLKSGLLEPFARSFVADPLYSSKPVNNFYAAWDEAKEAKSRRKIEDGLDGELTPESKLDSYFTAASKEIADLRAEEREVLARAISTEEKESRVEIIRRKINDIAKDTTEKAQKYKHLLAGEGTAVVRLKNSLTYKSMSDENKVKAVNKMMDYTAAIALRKLEGKKLEGWMARVKDVEKEGVSLERQIAIQVILGDKDIKGEVDKYGNTISGSVKEAKIKEITRQLKVAETEARRMYEAVENYVYSLNDLESDVRKRYEYAKRHYNYSEEEFLRIYNGLKLAESQKRKDRIKALTNLGYSYDDARKAVDYVFDKPLKEMRK